MIRVEMNKSIYTHAIELVTRDIRRVITEEIARDTPSAKEHIDKLRGFITDTKYNNQYHDFSNVRTIFDLYSSIMVDSYLNQIVMTGVAFLIGSLGEENYNTLTKELSVSLSIALRKITYTEQGGAFYSEPKREDILTLLEQNPWLVFCLLCRHAWFNEEKEDKQQ